MTTPPNQRLGVIIAVIIALLVALYVLNMPDRRTGAEKLGDAIGQLPNGVDKAARELKDRTPGDKLKDAITDEDEKLKNSPNQ